LDSLRRATIEAETSLLVRSATAKILLSIQGGLEAPQKKINEIFGSKREDRFFNPFFVQVQKKFQISFFVSALSR